MRIAYFDCVAGISGDMALGALIDAGADPQAIRDGLAALPLEGYEIEVAERQSAGVRAVKVNVHAESTPLVRTYSSIRLLLEQADLPANVAATSQRIFRRLAEAEARVHRKEVELVTFHEVGGIDSIVDIVGTSFALDLLGIERVFASPVPTGTGMVRTDHGLLPLPTPAVVELLRGAPMYSRGVSVELVTPTGAAILAATAEGRPRSVLALTKDAADRLAMALANKPGEEGLFARDVTEVPPGARVAELESLQAALRRDTARLRTILDHVPTPIFVKDLDGRYLLANRRFAELCGATPEDMTSRT